MNYLEEAKQEILKLEAKVAELENQSSEKDALLATLLRATDEYEETPIIWITGPSRQQVANHLLKRSQVDEQTLHYLTIDTKYYVAKVHVWLSQDRPKSHDAIILALEDYFDEPKATLTFTDDAQVKVLICNDDNAKDYCVDEGIEWLNLKLESLDRVLEALSSTTWNNMQLKTRPGNLEAKKEKPSKWSEEEQVELLEKMMSRAKAVREQAHHLPDEERRQRAGDLAMELLNALGFDSDDEDMDYNE